MIVSELVKELSKYPKDAKVKATWEGTFEEVSVYLYKDGKTVMIDADADFYRDRFEYKKKNDEEFIIFKTQYTVKPKDLRKVEKNKDKVLVVHITSLKEFGDDAVADLGLWKSSYLVLYYKPILTYKEFKKWYLKCMDLDVKDYWYAPPGYNRDTINKDAEVLYEKSKSIK